MSTRPVVGVVASPHLAKALRDIGFKVVTDDGFRKAAVAISAALRDDPSIRVVAESMPDVGFIPWVTSTNAKSGGVILLPVDPAVDISAVAGTVDVVPLPAVVNDLLPRLGFAAAQHPSGSVRIEAREPEDAASFLVPLEPQPVPAVAPQIPESTAVPLFEDDDFLEPPAQLAPPVQPPAPAPARDLDDIFDVAQGGAAGRPAPQPLAAPEPLPQPVYTPPAPVIEPVYVPQVPATEPVYTPPAPVAEPAYVPPVPVTEPVYVPATPPYRPAPPPVAPTPYGEQARPEFRPDGADLFAQHTALQTSTSIAPRRTDTPVIVVMSGKGGVGKTTETLLLAQTAAASGLRVVVIDANRGQGDVRTSLRLDRVPAPTILDSIAAPPEAAVMTPDQINDLRPRALTPILFGVVLAPPRDKAGPEHAGPEVYGRVVEYARSIADLVVIDTQIIEGHKTDLFEGLIIPALRGGAWGVGIITFDYSAADNLSSSYRELAAEGVGSSHNVMVAAQWPDFTEQDHAQLVARYGQFATFLGVLAEDQNISDQKSLGNLLHDSPAVLQVNRAILHHVTGLPAFAPEEPRRRRGLFGWRS